MIQILLWPAKSYFLNLESLYIYIHKRKMGCRTKKRQPSFVQRVYAMLLRATSFESSTDSAFTFRLYTRPAIIRFHAQWWPNSHIRVRVSLFFNWIWTILNASAFASLLTHLWTNKYFIFMKKGPILTKERPFGVKYIYATK